MFSPQSMGDEFTSPSAFNPQFPPSTSNHPPQQQNHALNRSNLSTVSNGSSISGAAARRLMRREMNQQNMNINMAMALTPSHQYQQQSAAESVTSAASAASG